MRHWIAALALAWLTACAAAPRAEPITSRLPPPGGAVIVVEPQVELALLELSSRTSARPDWSAAARDHIALHTRNMIVGRGRAAMLLTRADISPSARQILLLHDAVRASIRAAETRDPTPPTIRHDRAWTLGAGARSLSSDNAATHALIISCDGDFTSAWRGAFVVGAAAIGALARTGLQRASASLVDLETGDIVWKNTVVARPEQDVRTAEGAQALVAALLKDAPL